MDQTWQLLLAALGGATLALLGTLVSPIIVHELTKRRERDREIWQNQLRKVTELEERAGYVAEKLGGYPREPELDTIRTEIRKIEFLGGGLHRHETIRQPVRDFVNRAGWILHNQPDFESHEERVQAITELNAAYTSLVTGCDKIVKK